MRLIPPLPAWRRPHRPPDGRGAGLTTVPVLAAGHLLAVASIGQVIANRPHPGACPRSYPQCRNQAAGRCTWKSTASHHDRPGAVRWLVGSQPLAAVLRP